MSPHNDELDGVVRDEYVVAESDFETEALDAARAVIHPDTNRVPRRSVIPGQHDLFRAISEQSRYLVLSGCIPRLARRWLYGRARESRTMEPRHRQRFVHGRVAWMLETLRALALLEPMQERTVTTDGDPGHGGPDP